MKYTQIDFGKDHWSLLAYFETQLVDKCLPIDVRRIRINNIKRHPMTNGCPFKWDDTYSTTSLKGEKTILGHDDIDCMDELEAEGYLQNNGTILNIFPSFTDKGFKAIAELRRHKATGGNFIDFKFSQINYTATA